MITPHRLSRFTLPAVLALTAAFSTVSTATAQGTGTLTTLHLFAGDDGQGPYAGLTFGTDGNLYGSTAYGSTATNGGGTIFKITPGGTLTTLHSASDSVSTPPPEGKRYLGELLQGADGNFYGTAEGGGSTTADDGTIFKITPDGAVTRLVLFSPSETGDSPSAALIRGTDGNFYGTTGSARTPANSSVFYQGTIFKITPGGVLTTLHRFSSGADDGDTPECTLCLGSDGNFYGTTSDTQSYVRPQGQTYGTVFKITPDGVFTTLHRFTLGGSGGNTPKAGLVEGPDGYFYGTTTDLFSNSALGTVFKISRDGAFTTLHQFLAESDGAGIYKGELIKGKDGKLYGTTVGGTRGKSGSVFSITTNGELTTLYTFTGGADGASPTGRLLQASDGSFYGTTYGGGVSSRGTVFHLSFPTHPAFFTGETALSGGVYYLRFAGGNPFGYYSYLADEHYIYHFDLGYEYVFDAADGHRGVYLYDFKSGGFFYTSPEFPFPYLYDFTLNTVLYYYPDPNEVGRYNTNGIRYFYRFDNGQIIVK